jgi:hypothetical protein
MSLSNFGEQFAAKTLRKFYQTAITPSITNSDYEGEIKKAGDRVNILSFLSDITLGDYSAGSDMSTESIVDSEDQLVVEKRKYYNFPIDKLEDLFTYAEDINDTLTENANKVLERTVDSYVLEQAQYAKAGSWVGINLRVTGATTDTMASIATSATGGTLTIMGSTVNGDAGVEDPTSGSLYAAGFTSADVGKPIRLTSGTTWATEWYRITAVNNTTSVAIENWDAATSGSDIPNGDILRGLYGGSEFTSDLNGDGKPTTQTGWGWEFQAAIPTTVSASVIYEQVTELAQRLDQNEIPDTDRHITLPPSGITMLRQASELQPAIAMAYEGVVLNGRVAKIGGMDVHMAAGVRVSTRIGHATSSGQGGDITLTASTANASQILANHRSMITFAYKWSESRVVDAENQFAKKYQGLHLYGAKVPGLRRKAGALLFGTF